MPRAVSTKEFAKLLRELIKKGKKGKDAQVKALAAKGEADEHGQITILTRTNHGESRLPDIEKYNLGDGYRLVVQLVDSKEQIRAFLFVGDHEDAERWLEAHRGYKWVRTESNVLDFVKCSDSASAVISHAINADLPEVMLELPLMRDVTETEWRESGFGQELKQYLLSITYSRWETDAKGIVENVERLSDTDVAFFVSDVLEHAYKNEFPQLHSRLALQRDSASVVQQAEAAAAMLSEENKEKFVTWDDMVSLGGESSWADWLLFLHKEQRDFVSKEFNGPARLRGVSGSGKTSVMVHRARSLALKYRERVILLTLTESTTKLLDLLCGQLCGVELAYIRTSTMFRFADDLAQQLPNGSGRVRTASSDEKLDAIREAKFAMEELPEFRGTAISEENDSALFNLIQDEIEYVRTRLLPSEYDSYMKLKRHGRGIAFGDKVRHCMLVGLKKYEEVLATKNVADHEGKLQNVLSLMIESEHPLVTDCRSILVDEVQDLSQIEMRILAQVCNSGGTRLAEVQDGLFLVGDGAQSVYKRGFALKHCGVSIANRSYVLKKNYRNSREILEAAFELIKSYEFADVDEEQIQNPTEPDYSSRRGERPYIVKCSTQKEEEKFLAQRIKELRDDLLAKDNADGNKVPTQYPICIIGFTPNDRNRMRRVLEDAGIATSELRDDIGWDSDSVKISTLESAKGHEFQAVFIVGLVEGVLPHFSIAQSDWKRDAARLYVGMTRARDQLYLSYYLCESRPSPFLGAIQSKCQEVSFKRDRVVLPEES